MERAHEVGSGCARPRVSGQPVVHSGHIRERETHQQRWWCYRGRIRLIRRSQESLGDVPDRQFRKQRVGWDPLKQASDVDLVDPGVPEEPPVVEFHHHSSRDQRRGQRAGRGAGNHIDLEVVLGLAILVEALKLVEKLIEDACLPTAERHGSGEYQGDVGHTGPPFRKWGKSNCRDS